MNTVEILYSNTRLNYDMCAVNLVAIFEHLSKRLPQFKSLSQSVINYIEVTYKIKIKNSISFICNSLWEKRAQ